MTGPISPSRPRRLDSVTVSDPSGMVTVAKQVSKGERLVITADDHEISLDALLLESLVWQPDSDSLSEIVDHGELVADDPVARYDSDLLGATTQFTIANEYSQIAVSKIETEAGEGLKLTEPGLGSTVLGPMSLRALAAVPDTFRFSKWFRTPNGPEPSI